MIFTTISLSFAYLSELDENIDWLNDLVLNWQQTEKGQWVMSHCPFVSYSLIADHSINGYKVTVQGELSEQDTVYYTLKFR